jgi:hypothetical protein
MARRTWIWVVLGVVIALTVGCLALVGTGVYLVSRTVDVSPAGPEAAAREFEAVRARFAGQAPLFRLEAGGRVSAEEFRRRAASYSGPLPVALHLLVWNDREARLVRFSIPFWILRFSSRGRPSLRIDDFELDRLDISPDELEQAGPALVLDHEESGARVLVWTD